MNQQVRQDRAAILTFLPTEGRASAATVTIRTSGDEALPVPVSAELATVDPVTTTTDGAAGASEDNRRLVPLTSTANVAVGEVYRLTDATGLSEPVTVAAINAGVSVLLKSDLEEDYTTGAAFVGTRLSYTLAAENTAEDDKDTDFRVEWTYTVAGVEYIRETFYDVVRAPWYCAADLPGLEAANREVYARAKTDDVPFADILAEGWEEVLRRIDAKGWRPGLIIGMNRLAQPTYLAALVILANMGYRPAGYTDLETWIDLTSKRFVEGLGRALAGVTWYDKADAAERPADPKPVVSSSRILF